MDQIIGNAVVFIGMYITFSTLNWISNKRYVRRIKRGTQNGPIEKYYLHLATMSKREMKRLRSISYRSYLYSEHWKILRAAVLFRDNYKCVDCGIRNGISKLQAHHLSYARRGYERVDDLISVCDACHEKRHGIVH